MKAGRVLLLALLAVPAAFAAEDLCLSERKTQCDAPLTLIGGTCVEADWNATTCIKDAKSLIIARWYFPENKDICNLDECFCYCNENHYFFTIFFPGAPSTTRKTNNDGKLVPDQSAKCWCHNHAGKVTQEGSKYAIPIEQCDQSPTYGIVVTNGLTKSARASTYSSHYDCARFAQPGSRSQAMAATDGLPPGLGPTKSLTEQCLEGQVCYDAGAGVNGPDESAGKQTECFCNCFKQGYYFAAWNEKANSCKCSNRKINGAAVTCKDNGNQLKVLKRTSTLKRVCCEAVTEVPPTAPPATEAPTTAPEGGSRSQAMEGGPPPMLPTGGSRSQAMPGGPPPMLPTGGSRSQPMSGGPPPMPPPGGSRSQPMSGGPPPPSFPPASPETPTVGIADEPGFVIPYDIDLPESDLPPFDIDYFYNYPPDPLPNTYVIDLILPPEQPDWEPPTPVDWEPDIYIVTLPYLENPPATPSDLIYFMDPLYEYQLPPIYWEYPDPINWTPDPLLLPLEPLDWIWPLDNDWDKYWPDLDSLLPSMLWEPSVIYSYF